MSEIARYSITSEDRTGPGIKSAQSNFQSFGSTISKLSGPLMALAGVGGFGAMIGSALKAGDELQKLSLQTGATTEFLSEMQFVAERSGVAFTSFERALRTQSTVLADAANGARGHTDSLRRLGLEASELINLRPEDAFLRIGEALRGVANDTERAALAQKFFGGRAAEVLKITQQGTDAIGKMREQAQKFGLSLSGEQANAMASFADSMTNLKASFQGFTRQIAGDAAPVLALFADILTNVVGPVLRGALWLMRQFTDVLSGLGKAIGGFTAAAVSAVTGNFREAASIAGSVISDINQGIGESEKKAKSAAKGISEALGPSSPVADDLASLSQTIDTESKPRSRPAASAASEGKRESSDALDRLVTLTTEQVRLLTQIADDGRTGGAVLG